MGRVGRFSNITEVNIGTPQYTCNTCSRLSSFSNFIQMPTGVRSSHASDQNFLRNVKHQVFCSRQVVLDCTAPVSRCDAGVATQVSQRQHCPHTPSTTIQ